MTSRSFLEELDVEHPIVQAPMAGVSTPQLAAAVTNAGGLGSLGIGAMTADQGSAAILATRQLTTGPFNVNVFCHAAPIKDVARESAWLAFLAHRFAELGSTTPEKLGLMYTGFNENEQVLEMLLELKPAVVSFHFGLPSKRKISMLRGAGIRLIATATNLQEAKCLNAAGLDAIVAQGIEAGGHRGVFDNTMRDEKLPCPVLARILVKQQPLPVIAAGGVMDGAGVAAARALGAQAVQLGTAFLVCPESSADNAYRDALYAGGSTGTSMMKAISGRPARGLVNSFSQLDQHPACPPVPAYPIAYAAGKALHAAAVAKGSIRYAAHWAGQGVAMVRPMKAAVLVKTLAAELAEAEEA